MINGTGKLSEYVHACKITADHMARDGGYFEYVCACKITADHTARDGGYFGEFVLSLAF